MVQRRYHQQDRGKIRAVRHGQPALLPAQALHVRPEHAVALCAVIAEIRQRNIPAQRPHGTEEGGGGLVGRHAERLLRRPPCLPAGYAVCLHAVRPDRIAEQPQGVQRQPDVGRAPDLPGQAQGAVPAQVGQGKQQSRNKLTADVAGKAEGIRMQTAPHRDACFRPCEEHTLRPADVLIHGQRACKEARCARKGHPCARRLQQGERE